jgi:hypothetical protein
MNMDASSTQLSVLAPQVRTERLATNNTGSSLPAYRPEESCIDSKLAAPRILPDPAICRAKVAGFGDYADCLVKHPFECLHALRFGWGILCQHPQRKEIVRRTASISQGWP